MANIFKSIRNLIDPPHSRQIRAKFLAELEKDSSWTTAFPVSKDSIALEIRYYRHTSTACIPEYQHDLDAGCDLFADVDITIEPGRCCLVSTGLSILIPRGFEMQIRPRSGMAKKYGITVLNAPGTIDAGYKGLIGVLLYNTSDRPYQVSIGDRIAQAVFAPVAKASFSELSAAEFQAIGSERGSGGFGSTGGAA